jgi:multidrug efflux pump subunit AcrA (membrane-fusion protein)
VEHDVTDYVDFTGRTAAIESVEVRARVDGYLDSIHFKAGALVKRGDVLFVIDQRPFVRNSICEGSAEQARAEYQQALTQIESAAAAKTRSDADLENTRFRLERAAKLVPKGAMSQEEFDERKSELLKAEADVRNAIAGMASAKASVFSAKAAEASARAAVAIAELNLEYTTVTAPISGRISRNVARQFDPAGQTGRHAFDHDRVGGSIYAWLDVDEHSPASADDPRRKRRSARDRYQFGLHLPTKRDSRIEEPSTSSTIRFVPVRAHCGCGVSFQITTNRS